MTTVNTEAQLLVEMQKQILYPLLKNIAKQVEGMIQKELGKAKISTSTMQKYVTHTIMPKQKGYICEIFINDSEMEMSEASTTAYNNGYNKFMSLDLSTSYGGKSIVYQMIKWLEYGTENISNKANPNYFGNQPIKKVGMFEKVYNKLEKNIERYAKAELKKMGFDVAKQI